MPFNCIPLNCIDIQSQKLHRMRSRNETSVCTTFYWINVYDFYMNKCGGMKYRIANAIKFNYVIQNVIFSKDNDINNLRRANKLRHQKLCHIMFCISSGYILRFQKCYSNIIIIYGIAFVKFYSVLRLSSGIYNNILHTSVFYIGKSCRYNDTILCRQGVSSPSKKA